MTIHWTMLRDMFNCPYKAWQLINEGKTHTISLDLPDKLTLPDKIALAASQYPEIKPQRNEAAVKKLYNSFREMIQRNEAPAFYKISHCTECQFRETCYQKLKNKDCISLLAGMSANVLAKYHSKGIFTTVQLSHLFRLRRRKRIPKVTGRYLYELKALAIREKKTYVLQSPDIKEMDTAIYLDFEGTDENFIYLVGAILKQKGKEEETFSFWANSSKEEEIIFASLFNLLEQYPEAEIYHYGSYELQVLKKKYKELFSSIEKRMINLLGYFRTHVYPPTYSNGLKEIGKFLGFEWSDADADGLQSMQWRKNWEHTAGEKWKTKLIQYNLDDCKALARVHEWLKQLVSDNGQDNVQQVSEMKKHSPYRLQNNPEFGEDFQYISKAAYFDYQRTKIYWRTEKKVSTKSAISKKTIPKPGRGQLIWRPKHVNEIVQMPVLKRCPICNHRKVYHLSKQRTFRVTDLKFTPKGIRQWVIEYHSGSGKCAKCRQNYNDSILKQIRFGNNLFAWSINLYVNYKVSFAMITRLLQEQFGILTNYTYFNERNYYWWQRFKPEVDYCWRIIHSSPVIHIDETTVRLAKGKDRGYVWAFATSHTVFYHLTLTREAGFLQEWLKDYKGVIVTDFFPAYESLPIRQQKCLIHLIRDLNDDLFKNPFDDEYKKLVNAFSQLLKKIVTTIDKYGLKKLNLNKHKKDTTRFYKDFIEPEHKSELYIKYVKRFKKHWDQLWTFLSCDGIPWNNNNAEAAIKAFAQHRRSVNGQVSENGLKEYLSMLGIAQTCRYREISFLDFLRGKAGIWQNIHQSLLPEILPYNQARLFTNKLKLQNKKEWIEWKDSSDRPAFISPEPDSAYREKGWKSWEDWLGI